MSTNKNFGLVFFIVFLLIAVWPLKSGELIRVWAVIASLTFLILGLLNSRLLSPLNLVWVNFGNYLGKFIAPIIMGLIYFFILTPIGLLMRLLRKDILKKNFSKKESYWIKREKDVGSMKKQF